MGGGEGEDREGLGSDWGGGLSAEKEVSMRLWDQDGRINNGSWILDGYVYDTTTLLFY